MVTTRTSCGTGSGLSADSSQHDHRIAGSSRVFTLVAHLGYSSVSGYVRVSLAPISRIPCAPSCADHLPTSCPVAGRCPPATTAEPTQTGFEPEGSDRHDAADRCPVGISTGVVGEPRLLVHRTD